MNVRPQFRNVSGGLKRPVSARKATCARCGHTTMAMRRRCLPAGTPRWSIGRHCQQSRAAPSVGGSPWHRFPCRNLVQMPLFNLTRKQKRPKSLAGRPDLAQFGSNEGQHDGQSQDSCSHAGNSSRLTVTDGSRCRHLYRIAPITARSNRNPARSVLAWWTAVGMAWAAVLVLSSVGSQAVLRNHRSRRGARHTHHGCRGRCGTPSPFSGRLLVLGGPI